MMIKRELGSPEVLHAAEATLGRALASAQDEGGDHHAAFAAVLKQAGQDMALAGAIIFLHLSYGLEAVYRAEAPLN